MKALFTTALLIAMSLPAIAAEPESEHVHDDYVGKMAEQHQHDVPTATPIAERPLVQKVYGDYYDYLFVDGKTISGYLVQPANAKPKAKLPGVIVIHEWWGLNANVEAMSRQLAAQGYRVLAVDLYNGGRAQTPEVAKDLMTTALQNQAAANANMKAAYALLKAKGSTKVATLGWCFGGAQSLQASLAMPNEIAATVIYYGQLPTDPAKLAALKHPVMGFFGGADGGISVDSVRAFESALKAQGTPVEINVYAATGHAFANPSGKNYQPKAAEDAWQRTTTFLAQNLK